MTAGMAASPGRSPVKGLKEAPAVKAEPGITCHVTDLKLYGGIGGHQQ